MQRTRPRRTPVVVAGVVMALSQLLGMGPATAAAGALDPSFSVDGKVTTAFGAFPEGGESSAEAVAIQPDGKILAAGAARLAGTLVSRFAVARYGTDGTLDPSFGTGGKVVTTFNGDAFAADVAVQADGKIVLAGTLRDRDAGPSRFALARYEADGSLDRTFGGDGKVTTRLSGTSVGWAVALQPDGKIVAAGSTVLERRTVFALVRYDTTGTPDRTFGGDGRVTTAFGFGRGWRDVEIQSDGKIVAAGTTQIGGPVFDLRFMLARYDTTGALDGSFGGTGLVVTGFANTFGGSEAAAEGLAIGPDGKIVVAGDYITQNAEGTTVRGVALARYEGTDGGLDTSFSGNGKVRTRFGPVAAASAVAIQPDGHLVTAGFVSPDPPDEVRFALLRYDSSGELDPTFAEDGKVMTAFGTRAVANDVAIQGNGRIVAVGSRNLARFALARYLSA